MKSVLACGLLSGLCLLSACGTDDGDPVTGRLAAVPLIPGAGPDGSFYAAPADGSGKSLATRWPILLSHPFSLTAERSFRGDTPEGSGFDAYGVKKMLEAGGAVVYQPDKLAYGAHETRGRLLYKKCAGSTLPELLCEGDRPQPVDGVYLATLQYCGDAALRARSGFGDEDSCRRGLKFNLICHSQGCPDSRYMLAAVRNEFSGELMYRHLASWTSMAGANKGTAQADWTLEMTGSCLSPGCRSPLVDLVLAADSYRQNGALIVNGSESAVALSRKYMLLTTDMDCDPGAGKACAPSFNQLYPLPVDPEQPVYYQSFSSQIDDISHPCYARNELNWRIVLDREGPNDGNISVDSQKFSHYGPGATGGVTPVLARWVSGRSSDPSRPHPGLNHMAYADSKVPGLDEGRLSCQGEDNSQFRFSRLGLYRDIVAELVLRGY
ncbi:hypothetical protein ED208_11095 [Stagnimonas aquatica]|uniref:Lipoprotein n=1 Tax=Stagnimonas aquatica TaxID=2689987 RepID=A0A3N0VAI6_9GAMM|nr:hypothetical protein [Stagnimonas aquatica]ROH89662.1 hypothetical protein ED208_11095 [Stagnimonas aquatica]